MSSVEYRSSTKNLEVSLSNPRPPVTEEDASKTPTVLYTTTARAILYNPTNAPLVTHATVMRHGQAFQVLLSSRPRLQCAHRLQSHLMGIVLAGHPKLNLTGVFNRRTS